MFEKTENKRKRGRGWPTFFKKTSAYNLGQYEPSISFSMINVVDVERRASTIFTLQMIFRKE